MNRIKELRKKNGLTQEKLSKILSVSQANLSGWELDKWQPDQEALKTLAKYFNVSVDYLLGITDSIYTAEDYADGVQDTKKVSITADQEDIFDKTNEVLELLGEKGKELIIEFCDMIIKQWRK